MWQSQPARWGKPSSPHSRPLEQVKHLAQCFFCPATAPNKSKVRAHWACFSLAFAALEDDDSELEDFFLAFLTFRRVKIMAACCLFVSPLARRRGTRGPLVSMFAIPQVQKIVGQAERNSLHHALLPILRSHTHPTS